MSDSAGRGLFVVLEGIDGAGTTTQGARLQSALQERSIPCHLTHEPSDGPIGKLCREFLQGKHEPSDATSLGLLFSADRADHLRREVDPALERGEVVISDRYYYSSLAYQGSDEQREWINLLNDRARVPDCCYFLRVPPKIAASRRAKDGREEEEIYDKADTQARVAKAYDEVMGQRMKTETIVILDGTKSADEIAEQIRNDLLERLGA